MCTPNVRDSVIVASGDPPAATIGLTGVTVDFSSNPGGQVNVNVFNCSPFGLNNNVVEKMWEIISTMSAGSFMLDLRIDYTDQEIAGLNEDSLTIAYLNPLDSVWWQLSSVEVFADGNYLIAHNLDHFTMFAIGESSSFNGPTIFTDLKVFLQGPYNDGSMSTTLLTNGYIPLTQPYNISPWYYSGNESVSAIPAGTVDWILVELRTGTTPSTTVTTRAGFLKSDGRVVDLDGNSPLRMPGEETGNYYVVIHHRNHLSVMSSSAVSLSNTGSTLYDFTTGSSQYYGTGGARDLGSRVWGMYGGEGNGSGIMTVADYNAALAERDVVGYNDRDYNLSGIVSINDANLSLVNRDVATQVP